MRFSDSTLRDSALIIVGDPAWKKTCDNEEVKTQFASTAEPYTLIPSQGWLTGMQSKLMMNLSDISGLRIVKSDLQQH